MINYESELAVTIRNCDFQKLQDEMAKVKIERLKLSGRITKEEMQRIKTLFPNTDIKINGSRI